VSSLELMAEVLIEDVVLGWENAMIVFVSGPRFRGFEMSNLFDRVVEKCISDRVKNLCRWDQ